MTEFQKTWKSKRSLKNINNDKENVREKNYFCGLYVFMRAKRVNKIIVVL